MEIITLFIPKSPIIMLIVSGLNSRRANLSQIQKKRKFRIYWTSFHYTQEEKNVREFRTKKILFPGKIRANLTDEELDTVIDKFYLGQMDVKQWRVDNYRELRRIFYSPDGDKFGALRKLRSNDAGEKAQGQIELDEIDKYDASVVARFPKE